MKLLPLLVSLSGKRCLIVGGGRIATRRASAISEVGAEVDVIALAVGQPLQELVEHQGGRLLIREFQTGDVTNHYDLVVAATNDRTVNRAIALEAKALEIMVNVVDDASLCDVAFPSVIDRDPLAIAISSGSSSPILSRLLNQRINAMIPSGYGQLAALVGKFRQRVRDKLPNTNERTAFWENVLQGMVAENVFSGNQAKAEALLEVALDNPDALRQQGEVYLIGAGPGDPDLLTLRAFRLLQQSDVVIHDRLVSQAILDCVDENTDLIYVGKQRSHHSVPQQGINQLLVDLAQQGKRVARLKGGDPFVFGRGGEEIEELAEHKIPFQIIPGITAAVGCASYAGIPLTHRDHAQSVRFITAQLQDGTINLNWSMLVEPEQTLVFYMGLTGLEEICRQLISHGMPPIMPIALVEKGTCLDQRVIISTLSDVPEDLTTAQLESPTLAIVGTVVSLHDKLAWFSPTDVE